MNLELSSGVDFCPYTNAANESFYLFAEVCVNITSSREPTAFPTTFPTSAPVQPTAIPTTNPTLFPTASPTIKTPVYFANFSSPSKCVNFSAPFPGREAEILFQNVTAMTTYELMTKVHATDIAGNGKWIRWRSDGLLLGNCQSSQTCAPNKTVSCPTYFVTPEGASTQIRLSAELANSVSQCPLMSGDDSYLLKGEACLFDLVESSAPSSFPTPESSEAPSLAPPLSFNLDLSTNSCVNVFALNSQIQGDLFVKNANPNVDYDLEISARGTGNYNRLYVTVDGLQRGICEIATPCNPSRLLACSPYPLPQGESFTISLQRTGDPTFCPFQINNETRSLDATVC
ncbi:MAG: hypothetical protein AAGM67_18585, partial [Bacteroidota bacterium]